MSYAEAVNKSKYVMCPWTIINDQANVELGRDLNDHERSYLSSKYQAECFVKNIERVSIQ